MVDISKNMLCAGGNKTDSCKGKYGLNCHSIAFYEIN